MGFQIVPALHASIIARESDFKMRRARSPPWCGYRDRGTNVDFDCDQRTFSDKIGADLVPADNRGTRVCLGANDDGEEQGN